MTDARRRVLECQQFLATRLARARSVADRQSTSLAHRLYDQALACRMRPFADGVAGVSRAWCATSGARSASRCGSRSSAQATQVDRDILEKLDAPLGHLLRNAVDHGIETPDERRAAGKPAEGVVRLEAHHSAGALQIIVSDDGRGIDIDKLREAVVKRGLASSRDGRQAERERTAGVPVPAGLHDEGARSPRSRDAASGSMSSRT